MFINKIGQYHLDYGINNQDYGFECNSADNRIVKCVLDGCSEGEHSEVGVKLYAFYLERYIKFNVTVNKRTLITRHYDKLLWSILSDMTVYEDVNLMLNYFCFTIVNCFEFDDQFRVDSLGDGCIILQKHDDTIEFVELKNRNEGNEYLVYNFIDPKYLTDYKDGVEVIHNYFSKEEYKNVGVATDGVRYILDNSVLKDEFKQLLLKGKENMIKLFINRNQKVLQDDITIAF